MLFCYLCYSAIIDKVKVYYRVRGDAILLFMLLCYY